MSRTETRAVLFSWLGELLWYLAGSDEFSFVHYYIKEYKPDAPGATRLMAAYGPRLRAKNKDQLHWIVELIKTKPGTRRAVIPVYYPKDTHINLAEVPCTCTLQFLLRGRRLEMITHMRSNDAYIGLPGDIFAFTMIQEIIARALGVEPGRYKHLVGSLHLYEADYRKARHYLAEGWQRRLHMPVMPLGDPFPNIERLLRFESGTRRGRHPKFPSDLADYWQDLARLLLIFRASREGASSATLRNLRKQMYSDVYEPYIARKQQRAQQREPLAEIVQLSFNQETHA